MVVELAPVADHAAGVLLAFEAMAVGALLLQRADETLHHPVLLRAVRGDELLAHTVAAHPPDAVAADEHQAVVRAQQEGALHPFQRSEADDQRLLQRRRRTGLAAARELPAQQLSGNTLRYSPRPGRDVALRQKIIALAHRHRRCGVGMIHLQLRQVGERTNYKRVERLNRKAHLQTRRRKRKKIPIGERQPLERPARANEVWSMDFVFDRTADSRVIKCLTVVDDATHEAVEIETERAISGHCVVRVLERLALSRGLPKVIRSDNGKEFCGRTMVTWAHERGVLLRLIEPPRLCRRLRTLRGWSDDEAEVFEGSPGASCAHGAAAPEPDHPSEWATIQSVAAKLGCTPQTLHN